MPPREKGVKTDDRLAGWFDRSFKSVARKEQRSNEIYAFFVVWNDLTSGNNRVGEGESQRSRQVPLPICGMYVGNYTTERGEEEKDRPRIRELYVPTFPWLVASAPAYAYAMTYRSIG